MTRAAASITGVLMIPRLEIPGPELPLPGVPMLCCHTVAPVVSSSA
jgi:hypothetical protein